MPAIEDGDFTLADSTAICAYLDAKYPEPALIPSNPAERGRAVWFEEICDSIISPAAGPMIFNRFVIPRFRGVPGDEAAAAASEAATMPIIDWLETQAPADGWLVGTAFSIGDIAIASALRTLAYVDSGVDASRHPRLAVWYGRVCNRPSWQLVADLEGST